MTDCKKYFDNIYLPNYYEFHTSIKDHNFQQEIFTRKIILDCLDKPRLNILDLGCGACDLEKIIGKKVYNKKSKIITIDKSSNMLKKCIDLKKDCFKLEAIAADALFCPITEKTFDIIFAINITPYIDNIQIFISEVCRVSKMGGLIVLITPKRSIFWNEEFEGIKIKFWEEISDFFRSKDIDLLEQGLIKFYPIPDIKNIEIEIADLSIFQRS